MSYESPVNLYDFVHEISEKFTEERDKYIYQRIRTYVDVDKAELIKALQYDRDQYKKGYEDGLKDAIPVVRCKDCKYGEPVYDLIGLVQDDLVYCKTIRGCKKIDWYCGDGERKEGEQE